MADSNITKNALAQSLKTCMKSKPFSKISVGDICDGCSMNRKSFYYHFKDKYDLVNWIYLTEFVRTLRFDDCDSEWDVLLALCRYFYQERSFYRDILQITGQNSFQDIFTDTLGPFCRFFAHDIFGESEPSAFFLDFFSDALLASLRRWLNSPRPMLPEDYVEKLKSIAIPYSQHVLSQLSAEKGADS